jgi:HPt (histidine-containing phosphotransfer) domain-containing protein
MNDVLFKPVTAAQLAAALTRWLPVASTAGIDLDLAVVDRLRRLQTLGEPDVVTALLQLFRSTADRHMTDLGAAVARGDAEAIRRIAHTLRGSSASLGLTAITTLAERLHGLAAADDRDAAGDVVAALARAIEALPVAGPPGEAEP